MTPRAWARRALVTFGLVLAVALALSLTWRAVTLIGQGAEPTVLSEAEVDAALATERAAATTGPVPTPTSDPTPRPTSLAAALSTESVGAMLWMSSLLSVRISRICMKVSGFSVYGVMIERWRGSGYGLTRAVSTCRRVSAPASTSTSASAKSIAVPGPREVSTVPSCTTADALTVTPATPSRKPG
mgnify:CR=1 FL=1